MGNCLKTQFMESVQNDNLPVFGEIVFTMNTRDAKIRLDVGNYTHAEIVGSGYFVNRNDESVGQSVDPYDGNILWIMGLVIGDKLKIKDKYTITFIDFEDTYVEIKDGSDLDLSWCGSAVRINLGNKNKPVFNLNEFAKTDIVLENFRNPYNTNIIASVETITTNQLSAGRTSGTLKLGLGHTLAEFHNETYEDLSLSWLTVEFTSATSATVYQGEGTSGTVLATYSAGVWSYT